MGFGTSEIISDKTLGLTYQKYENGVIAGNDENGYAVMNKSLFETRQKYATKLGVQIKGLARNNFTGIEWYEFKNGVIVGNDQKGWFISIGKSREVWMRKGFESGPLGFPTSDFNRNSQTGIEWQNYENGVIVGNDQKGWFESRGSIRQKWQNSGFESGRYGFPKSDIEYGHQLYEGGYINQ